MSPIARLSACCLPLLALLSACSLPLPYTQRNLEREQAATAFMARRLDDDNLRAFMVAAGRPVPGSGAVWDVDTLALAAAFFSPELALAQAHWRAALAHQTLANTVQQPILDTVLEHHSLVDGGRTSAWTLGVGLEILLRDPERVAARQALAQSIVEVARIDLADALWTVRRRVRTAYLEVQSSELEAQCARQRTAILAERVQRMEQLQSAGVLSAADVASARFVLAAAQASSAQSADQVTQARARLRVALSLPPGSEPVIAIETTPIEALPGIFDATAAQLGRTALRERSDFAAADWRFRAADAALRFEVAQQFPELSLKPGYEWDQGDHRLRIGMAFPVPLPEARTAPVRAAEAEREARAQELLALQEQILQEVTVARQEVYAAWNAVVSQRALTRSQDAQKTRLAAAIRLGERDRLDALDQALQALEQATRRSQAERALAQTLLRFEEVMHQPMTEHKI